MNGIGGRTVEEAKQRMSHAEFVDWLAYIKQRGTLNIGLRMEWLAARQAAQFAQARGGKSTMDTFLRYHELFEQNDAGDLAKLMRMLKFGPKAKGK